MDAAFVGFTLPNNPPYFLYEVLRLGLLLRENKELPGMTLPNNPPVPGPEAGV